VAELYAITLANGPKVAGKATQFLQLRPKDTLRLGHVLALDEASGVILRSDTISAKGELLERHEFATVTIVAVTGDEVGDKVQDDSQRFVKVPGLPRGYRASLARGYEGRALFVSDGIAAATVIFEPLPDEVKPGEGAVRRGATLTYTRGSLVSGNNILVTVIGEVPLAAARVIADAVKLTAGQR
jgi:sigma-E factor negative regulatory protein RseB